MKRLTCLAFIAAAVAPVLAQQSYTPPKNEKIPPADPYVAEALQSIKRHSEWADIKMSDGTNLRAWVVYPESSTKTGVVIVIHENRGINDWTRAVGDQVAEDGFIAIVPDMLSGKGPGGGGTEAIGTAGISQAFASFTPAERVARLDAAMAYGKTIPSSNGRTGVVGFCWGGGTTLLWAISQPALNAAVPYYGPVPTVPGTQTPDLSGFANVKAPILALYGGNDQRVNASIEPLTAEMKKLGKFYEPHVYDGAAHGFMHQRTEADYKAAEQSWPLVVAFFKKHLSQ